MSSDSYPANLGRPINANFSQNNDSSIPTFSSSSSNTQGALSAEGAAGDYIPNPFGHSGAGAGVIGGTGGEGRDTSYNITDPKSGYQALGDGESEPHAVRGSGGGGAAPAFGAAGGDFGTESGANDFGSATVTGREKYGGLEDAGELWFPLHHSSMYHYTLERDQR